MLMLYHRKNNLTLCSKGYSNTTTYIVLINPHRKKHQYFWQLCCSPIISVQDPLEFPAHELRKYFRMGDHVKVIAGRYEGDTGLIVRVEENFVILFSDLTMHEVNPT